MVYALMFPHTSHLSHSRIHPLTDHTPHTLHPLTDHTPSHRELMVPLDYPGSLVHLAVMVDQVVLDVVVSMEYQ